MAATESLPRAPFASDHLSPTARPRPIPILTTPTSSENSVSIPLSDPMDITPTSASMPPPTSSPPSADRHVDTKSSGDSDTAASSTMNGTTNDNNANGTAQLLGAAAAATQPTKVVQTAFIHKLYK
jgi:hypothetical protein